MADDKTPAAIGLAFAKAPPVAIDAGTAFSISVSLNWPEGADRAGAIYRVVTGEKPVVAGELPEAAEDGGFAFTLAAPEVVGEHRWVLVVASAANAKGERIEGSLPLVFSTIPHATSLAVWDTPSPVVRGEKFEVKIGAKCTAACGLAGKGVEIRDEAGKLMGSGIIGEATVPGTTGLYGAVVTLKAPRKLKLHEWIVSFSPVELKLPHGEATSRFTFIAVAEPAHSVSVKVVDKKTKAPVAGAQVRLGFYRAITDEKGAAKVRVPKGEFPLVVTRVGFEMPERRLLVSKDLRVQVGAEQLPEEDPFAAWTA
jgi:hypothetical protein